MTETVDLYLIARLDTEAAVADIYCSEVFYDLTDGTVTGPGIEHWWESVATSSDAPVSLDALDELLTTSGYTRKTGWRPRVTASGVMRFFADAVTHIEDLNR